MEKVGPSLEEGWFDKGGEKNSVKMERLKRKVKSKMK